MLSFTRRTLSVSGAAMMAGCASQQQTAASAPAAPAPTRQPPALGAWGVDLSARDLNVKPGDDFFLYCNGTWVAHTEIPSDRVDWGTFTILADKAERDVQAIIDEVAARQNPPGSNEQKISDYYSAFVDQERINALGLAPAAADLAAIDATRNLEDVVRLVGRADFPAGLPFGMGVTLDQRNPERYVVGMGHGGISLPDREYYLSADPDFVRIRTAYRAHVQRLFTAAGISGATAKAQAVLAFETEIARRHWKLEDRRDVEATYNLRTRAQIRALDARFPWDPWFEALGFAQVDEVVIAELSAMGPLAQLCRATPMATWRAYLTYRYLHNSAAVLPQPIDDENFDFYGKTLNGQPQQRARAKRGVAAVNGVLGKAVGKLYVERHFPPEAKAQMLALVENMRRAYGQRINGLSWMSAETKTAAQEKLATFMPKIGYPDSWRDYSAFEVRPGDAFGNASRAAIYSWSYDLARLGRPTDKSEWLYMDPQEINAYYNPVFNEIVFAAAILQPPFFDPNADPAVNYGAIGGVIGHEMGHGFDDQGAKSDAHGVLRDWWNAEDVRRFGALTHALAEQYNAFEPLPGLHINGQNTLGENIGDNGGLQVAHVAYQLSLNGAEAPAIDGFTGDQRFFLAWGQAWRDKMRDDYLRTITATNVHAPDAFRVNGSVRNTDAWYGAFNVAPGDRLYLPENERVEIW